MRLIRVRQILVASDDLRGCYKPFSRIGIDDAGRLSYLAPQKRSGVTGQVIVQGGMIDLCARKQQLSTHSATPRQLRS